MPADAGGEREQPTFDDFWATYPRHEGKTRAITAWRIATRRAQPMEILSGLTGSLPRLRAVSDPRFIPAPANWLRDERWKDDPAVTSTVDPDSPWRADLYLPPPGPGEREVDEGSENAP